MLKKHLNGYRCERTEALFRYAEEQGQRYNGLEDGMATDVQIPHQHPQQLEDVRIRLRSNHKTAHPAAGVQRLQVQNKTSKQKLKS